MATNRIDVSVQMTRFSDCETKLHGEESDTLSKEKAVIVKYHQIAAELLFVIHYYLMVLE